MFQHRDAMVIKSFHGAFSGQLFDEAENPNDVEVRLCISIEERSRPHVDGEEDVCPTPELWLSYEITDTARRFQDNEIRDVDSTAWLNEYVYGVAYSCYNGFQILLVSRPES